VLESVRPNALKALNLVAALGNTAGRLVTAFSIAGTAVAFGTTIYIASTAYGAYALRDLVGPELFNVALGGDDPAYWPTIAFAQLPVIPFSLIAYRTPLASHFPLLPLSLALLVFPLRLRTLRIGAGGRIVLDPSFGTPQALLAPADGHWPPSPYVAAGIVFPLVRYAYARIYKYVARRVIAHASLAEHERALRAQGQAAEAEVVIHVEREGDPPHVEAVQRPQPAHQPQAPGRAGDNNDGAVRRWRLTDRSFGRLLGGALLIPKIASTMGKLLLRFSTHSRILRWILAIRPSTVRTTSVATSLGLGKGIWEVSQLWTDHDPVWWRNAIGLGLFVMMKDCVTLWHLWLAKQELDSRQIKSLPFTDLDEGELDLIQR
jgi:hypothetical protein